jgi:hypothetical protein
MPMLRGFSTNISFGKPLNGLTKNKKHEVDK